MQRLKKNGWQREDIVDIATDSAVDIGATAGAAAAGAVAGSFFVPPVGTVVGAGVAVGATWLMNYKWGGKDNAIDYAKNGVKQINEKDLVFILIIKLYSIKGVIY